METVTDFIFLGFKIIADGDCIHEIKRHLLLGKKGMTNLGRVLKSRDITLPIKVCIVKAMVFPVVMYGRESWTIEKAREFQKNIYIIDYTKAFDCVDHNKLWKILKEMGIPDHLTCLLRNLYVGQEATVRTGYGRTDWFRIGEEYNKAVYVTLLI